MERESQLTEEEKNFFMQAAIDEAKILSRVEEVYFGAYDPKGGTAGTLMNLLTDERFNHRAYVEGGILEAECGALLTNFFRQLRARKKKTSQKE